MIRHFGQSKLILSSIIIIFFYFLLSFKWRGFGGMYGVDVGGLLWISKIDTDSDGRRRPRI